MLLFGHWCKALTLVKVILPFVHFLTVSVRDNIAKAKSRCILMCSKIVAQIGQTQRQLPEILCFRIPVSLRSIKLHSLAEISEEKSGCAQQCESYVRLHLTWQQRHTKNKSLPRPWQVDNGSPKRTSFNLFGLQDSP